MSGMSAQMIALAKDCVFPIFCFGCSAEGAWVCNDCRIGLDATGFFSSPEEGALSRFAAASPYGERRLVGAVLRAFKYQYATELMSVLRGMLHGFFSLHAERFQGIDAIVPVPLHPRRYAERGFNQAELIGNIVADFTGLPVLLALRRARYTRYQAKLPKEDRGENVAGAFAMPTLPAGRQALRADVNIAGKRLLLVDDVYTTGVTMQECARVLRAAGAISVSGFAVAHG